MSTTLLVKDSITFNTRTQSLLVNNVEIIYLVQKKNKETNLFQKDPVFLHSVHTDNKIIVVLEET